VRRLLLVTAVAGLLVPMLTGCGSDQDAYCDAVEDHQQQLSDTVGSDDPAALIDALDTFRDLQDKAPRDISDEWQQVVDRIEALQQALDDAGVDASTYDRAHPPAGLSSEQKASIDAAARELGSGPTLRAFQDLEQQARDVCHTPLTV
jgi:hypothetical protein